tara:strand:+ start:4961 stop:5314 length:354 start_codon:yes stop_codon:yes gene_type:complete
MNTKIIGWFYVTIGIFSFWLYRKMWVGLSNFFDKSADLSSNIFSSNIFFGQLFFYISLSTLLIIFGIIKIKEGKVRKLNLVIIFVIGLWFLLEIPMYKCDFYGIPHSFWHSQKFHFH